MLQDRPQVALRPPPRGADGDCLAGRQKLIVGIDPGTTSAFAALSLDRRLVSLYSKRDAGREEMVSAMSEAGDPAVIATDVSVPPEFVTKIAAAFNARLSVPPKDMREPEKVHLSRGFAFSNAHERDAIASAVKAYNAVANTLRKVERTLKEQGMADKVEEAQSLVLGGMRMDDVLSLFSPPKPQPAAAKPGSPGFRDVEAELSRKDGRIRSLAASLAELRKANERLEAEKAELHKRIESLRRGAKDRAMADSEVRRKTAEAERAKAFAKSLLAEIRKLKGAKTPLKRQGEKKGIDLEGIVADYRAKR
jgi:predicted RNase H-like nuclease (RuvC/YqgF family)